MELLIRRSKVRILPGTPINTMGYEIRLIALFVLMCNLRVMVTEKEAISQSEPCFQVCPLRPRYALHSDGRIFQPSPRFYDRLCV